MGLDYTHTQKGTHFLTNKCSFSSRLPNPIPKGEVTSHGRMFKAEQLRYHEHINSTVHPLTSFTSYDMIEGLIPKLPNPSYDD